MSAVTAPQHWRQNKEFEQRFDAKIVSVSSQEPSGVRSGSVVDEATVASS